MIDKIFIKAQDAATSSYYTINPNHIVYAEPKNSYVEYIDTNEIAGLSDLYGNIRYKKDEVEHKLASGGWDIEFANGKSMHVRSNPDLEALFGFSPKKEQTNDQ